jgi:phosphosulfolactate synthase
MDLPWSWIRVLSVREVEDFLSIAEPYVDIVKLGFGTSAVTPSLKKKIAAYKSAGIPVYFGGSLLEWFYAHNAFDDYLKILDEYGIEYAEVSDGSLEIPHDQKCDIIRNLAKTRTVLSEVGSQGC